MSDQQKPIEETKTQEIGEFRDEFIEELIKKTVDKHPELTEPEKQMQIEALRKICYQGMKPKDAIGFDEDTMNHFYNYAYELYNSAKFADAATMFRLLTVLDSSNVHYMLGLAASWHQLKMFPEACYAYMACTLLDTSSPIPFYHMSDCFLQANDPQEAYIILQAAVQRCGEDPVYTKLKARCIATMTGLKKEIGSASE